MIVGHDETTTATALVRSAWGKPDSSGEVSGDGSSPGPAPQRYYRYAPVNALQMVCFWGIAEIPAANAVAR
jgi:hypothetical protein